MFKAARLHLPLSGEAGMPIGKMRGALKGMWMKAMPKVYEIDREPKTPAEPLSGKGTGDGTGSVGNQRGKKEVRAGVGELEGEGKGNNFIITVINHFTKYAFAFPVRNHEARTVAKYLVERVFLIHGVPLQSLSNRGAEFKGHIFKEICELLGVDKLRTTAYKPSTNGTLERMHRTLNTLLGKIVDEKQKDWDVHVAYVMTAYNATVHSATGFTLNRLVFGRD